MKKLIRDNKAKNAILKHLNKTDRLESEGIWQLSEILNKDIDLLFKVSIDLVKDEYTTEMNTTTRTGDSKLITITRKGKLHIKDGGYPSSGWEFIWEVAKKNRDFIIAVAAIIISILSYFKE